MNKNHWLAVSLGANLAAAFLLARGFLGASEPRLTESAARLQTSVSRAVEEEAGREKTAAGARAARPPRPSSDTNPLPEIWGRIAVADYQQFAGNLRAIGVPEETVRDIVMLDLFKSLGAELTGLAARGRKPFWQTGAYGPKPPPMTNEVGQSVAQMLALSRQVLGVDPSSWMLDRWGWLQSVVSGPGTDFSELEILFAGFDTSDGYEWLAPDRLRSLQQVQVGHELELRELQKRRDGAGTDAERAELDRELERIDADHDKALDAFLTAAEKREKALREDGDLQRQLAGVEVTREEYERLFDLARASGASNAPYFAAGTPEAAQATGILGVERFAEFQRGSDPKYGQLLSACAEQDLPAATAKQLDDIRRACVQSLQAGTPAVAARQQAMAAFQSVLGEEAFKTMQGQLGSFLPRYTTYHLKQGDTLESVAAEFETTAGRIMQASGIAPGAALAPGQPIQIPRE